MTKTAIEEPAMKLSGYRTMDPRLLPGLVNTELRNQCEDLEDLVLTHDLERGDFLATMHALGYRYRTGENQFRLETPGGLGEKPR